MTKTKKPLLLNLESLDQRIVPARATTAVGTSDNFDNAAVTRATPAPPPVQTTPAFNGAVQTRNFVADPSIVEAHNGSWAGGEIKARAPIPVVPEPKAKPEPAPRPTAAPLFEPVTETSPNANDVVIIDRVGAQLQITHNGVTRRTDSNVVVVDLKGGKNVVNVRSLAADDVVRVANSSGDAAAADDVRIGSGSLSTIRGRVEVSNNSGRSQVTLNDSLATAARNYSVGDNAVKVDGQKVVGYQPFGVGAVGGVDRVILLSSRALPPAVPNGVTPNLIPPRNLTTVNNLHGAVEFTQTNSGSWNTVEVRAMAGSLRVNSTNGANDIVQVRPTGSLAAVSGTIAVSNTSSRTAVDLNAQGNAVTATRTELKVANGPTIRTTTEGALSADTTVTGVGYRGIRVDGFGGGTKLRVVPSNTWLPKSAVIFGAEANSPNVEFVGIGGKFTR